MRKFYSLVLIAAALLIGTNVKAENELRVGTQHYSDLQAAFDAAGDGATINLEDNMTTNVHATLNADKYIILDLGGNTMTFNCADVAKNIAILIKQGRLMIQNGTISNASNGANYTVDLIRLNGTTAENDAKEQTPYSQVIVAANALLQNNVTKSGAKFNVLTICEATGTNKLANGARIDVYGELDATTYGIKVNGNIVPPTNTNNAPYVYIHKGATVGTNDTGSGSVAAYSSGYARWRIEGTCEGSTGLYAKGGQVEIVDNAVIQSNNPYTTTTVTGGASGVNTGGSAIVVESNENYPGFISVTISGNAQVTAASGYAIEETIAAGDDSQVDLISIQGGSITGGDKGAIIVEEESENKVTVVGGNIEGTLQIEGATETVKVTVEEFITGTTTQNPEAEADYLVIKDTTDPNHPTYNVTPNTSKVVTLNSYGLGTFSAIADRTLTSAPGLKAYTAEFNGLDNVLTLHQITSIPANTGVFLYGEAGHTYTLTAAAAGSLSEENDLKPSTYWGSRSGDIYVLSGGELHPYAGSSMKDNKAFLQIPVSSGAPARVRLVFAEEEEATAIENVEAEAVKAEKFFENGMIFIQRGENIYNIQGQIVK